MYSPFIYFLFASVGFNMAVSTSFHRPLVIDEFCKSRPLGLYCSPESIYQKIECPSGNITTCSKTPYEFCQERGILKQYGFKGGVARCVPFLSNEVIQDFCKDHQEPGSYCYNDRYRNIRIVCPQGLIYKCADEPTRTSRKCAQKFPQVAVCRKPDSTDGGEIQWTDCDNQVLNITETVKTTVLTTVTKRIQKPTKTVTNTVTKFHACDEVKPLPTMVVDIDTTINVVTRTRVIYNDETQTMVTTSAWMATSQPTSTALYWTSEDAAPSITSRIQETLLPATTSELAQTWETQWSNSGTSDTTTELSESPTSVKQTQTTEAYSEVQTESSYALSTIWQGATTNTYSEVQTESSYALSTIWQGATTNTYSEVQTESSYALSTIWQGATTNTYSEVQTESSDALSTIWQMSTYEWSAYTEIIASKTEETKSTIWFYTSYPPDSTPIASSFVESGRFSTEYATTATELPAIQPTGLGNTADWSWVWPVETYKAPVPTPTLTELAPSTLWAYYTQETGTTVTTSLSTIWYYETIATENASTSWLYQSLSNGVTSSTWVSTSYWNWPVQTFTAPSKPTQLPGRPGNNGGNGHDNDKPPKPGNGGNQGGNGQGNNKPPKPDNGGNQGGNGQGNNKPPKPGKGDIGGIASNETDIIADQLSTVIVTLAQEKPIETMLSPIQLNKDLSCPSDGSVQPGIAAPPNSPCIYQLTSVRVTEMEARIACMTFGSKLSTIDSPEEHDYLASQICEPVWYDSWEDKNYEKVCIALYPGGSTGIPPDGCGAKLPGLCKSI